MAACGAFVNDNAFLVDIALVANLLYISRALVVVLKFPISAGS